MAAVPPLAQPGLLPALRIGYEHAAAEHLLQQTDVLAVIGFAPGHTTVVGDPRRIQVPLQPLAQDSPLEVWRVPGPIRHGRDGSLAWAASDDYLMLALRIDEGENGGLERASQIAYARLMQALRDHDHRHLLRAWNYLADINAGDGDDERYRRFSIGRALGIGELPAARFPAATAIGRLDGIQELVVYLLAGRQPGVQVENPRQISAYRYPREYGPVPPSFARAMRLDTCDGPSLLISGTSSVVGHATVHGHTADQSAETLINLDTLAQTSGLDRRLPMANACLKAYLRDAGDADLLRSILTEAGLSADRLLCLHGDICRAGLLMEIDGIATAVG